MDLVGAEGRRGGTRGGRNQFTWESVKPEERGFYLGNSTAEASTALSGQRHHRRTVPLDWYARPPMRANADVPRRSGHPERSGDAVGTSSTAVLDDGAGRRSDRASASAQPESLTADGIELRSIGRNLRMLGNPLGVEQTAALSLERTAFDDAASVRRREKAMLDAAIGGRSFSEAVRAALVESESASGVDDEPEPQTGRRLEAEARNPTLSGDIKMSEAPSREERVEKMRRKEERARRREERRARRFRRKDSSESERESLRSRKHEECDRRRRRRERESDRDEYNRRSIRRPRSEDEEEDSHDSNVLQRARRRQRHR